HQPIHDTGLHSVVRALERMATFSLNGEELRDGSYGAKATGIAQPAYDRAGESPAAHLHEDRTQDGPLVRELRGELVAKRLHDLEPDREAHQVARFVGARHVPGLVLDPHAAIRGEPESLGEGVLAAESGDDEPRAVDGADLLVEALHELDVLRVGHPPRGRQMMRAKELTVPNERVRFGSGRP